MCTGCLDVLDVNGGVRGKVKNEVLDNLYFLAELGQGVSGNTAEGWSSKSAIQ